MSRHANAHLQPGEVIAGKYEIEATLGEGGMGYVVAARHLQLGERVAIKLLLPELAAEPEIHGRFLREARASVRIKSEHIVRVLDVGELPSREPFMVMEFLAGKSLADLIESGHRFTPGEVAEYLLQASEAIAEAHALGVIHRDLKPANLFLTRRLDDSVCIKVLDFGISKDTQSGDAWQGLTSTQQVLGSPQYMSPEQLSQSREVDARTDIWALGVTMYQMLTHKFPFNGETIPALCLDIVQGKPVPPSVLRPDVPAAMDRLILRCLEKDRNDRFDSIASFAQALSAFAPGRGSASAERIGRVMASGIVPRVATPPRRSPKQALLWGSVAVIIAAAATAWVLSRGGQGTSQMKPAPAQTAAPSAQPPPAPAAPAEAERQVEPREASPRPPVENTQAHPRTKRTPQATKESPSRRNPLDVGLK